MQRALDFWIFRVRARSKKPDRFDASRREVLDFSSARGLNKSRKNDIALMQRALDSWIFQVRVASGRLLDFSIHESDFTMFRVFVIRKLSTARCDEDRPRATLITCSRLGA